MGTVKKHLLSMTLDLLAEASGVIRRMNPEEFNRLKVRHFLCDEMEGAVLMLQDELNTEKGGAS